MKELLFVGSGGFIGSVLRYFISQYIQSKPESGFPYGTLAVNIIGCFLIGIVYALFSKGELTNDWKLFLATGICGGFTTFSAFSNEMLMLFKSGNITEGVIYLTVSIVAGLLATLSAYLIIKSIAL